MEKILRHVPLYIIRNGKWASAWRQIDFLNPYGAIKYSLVKGKVTRVRSDLQLSCSSFHMRNRDHIGLVFGCTFTTGDYFDLTVESRFLDEVALSLAANMSF